MQTKITIRNEAQRCYIDIEGTIGVSEECQWESADNRVATFERLRQEVKRIAAVKADEVIVNIRSTGGDVNDALLIYDALRSLDATITTRCYGYTASAATIIAQAADPGCREISANSLYLIHSATCSIDGNSHSLNSRAELLRKTDERLAELYALHSDGDPEYYAQLMAENQGEGRWLSAEEAIEAGLADAIIDEEENSLTPSEEEAEPTNPTKEESNDEEEAEPSEGKLMPQNARKMQRKGTTIAGSIIRYLLSRLAYRIEEWIESIREKRAAKKAEKAAEEQTEQPTQSDKTKSTKQKRRSRRKKQEEESEQTTTEQTEEAEPVASEPSEMPQARAIAASASVITLRQRQSHYTRTAVKDCEDPSTASATALTNEKAYDEDARQFSQR